MIVKKKITLGIIALLLSFPLLFADGGNESEPAILKVGDDTLHTEIQSAFEAFRGPLYSDPGLPAFTLVSKNNRVAAGIGGYVRFTTSFDFGGIMPATDFIPSLIPVPKGSAQRSQFNFDATTSRIFLRVLADLPIGLLHFFVETDFRASGNRNRFTAIYASLNGWRIGRYWTVMADLEAYPPSIDFQGPNAFAGISNYQISYQGKFNNRFSYGIGLELPDYSLADSLSVQRMPQRIPTLPLYLQYNLSAGHLRLAGLARPLLYKNGITGSKTAAFTWAAVGSAYLTPTPKLSLYLLGLYGSGTATYSFEFNGLGLDLLPDPDHPGKLRPATFYGGFVGANYAFSKFFQASVIYSRLNLTKNKMENLSLYKLGQYLVFTGYFQVTPKLQLAVEYDRGRLDLRSDQHGQANRLMGMIRYDF